MTFLHHGDTQLLYFHILAQKHPGGGCNYLQPLTRAQRPIFRGIRPRHPLHRIQKSRSYRMNLSHKLARALVVVAVATFRSHHLFPRSHKFPMVPKSRRRQPPLSQRHLKSASSRKLPIRLTSPQARASPSSSKTASPRAELSPAIRSISAPPSRSRRTIAS